MTFLKKFYLLAKYFLIILHKSKMKGFNTYGNILQKKFYKSFNLNRLFIGIFLKLLS